MVVVVVVVVRVELLKREDVGWFNAWWMVLSGMHVLDPDLAIYTGSQRGQRSTNTKISLGMHI